MSADTSNIQAPDFGNDTDGGSDSSTASDQNVHSGHDSAL